jgi:hypothetical protein
MLLHSFFLDWRILRIPATKGDVTLYIPTIFFVHFRDLTDIYQIR